MTFSKSCFFVRIFGMLVILGVNTVDAVAEVIHLYPPASYSCNEEFENTANSLKPGDELILHEGTYSQSCRRAISVSGTALNPIIIRAADNENVIITRPLDNIDTQNNIEISSSYLTLKGLKFRGGSTGVRFMGGKNITLEDSEIFETGNNAISMNSGNHDAFVIKRNHIHHTGLSSGNPEGEGMYIGCNYNNCRTTNSLIEGNYIHHLRSTSDGGNDGIEIKVGSYGNIIRNNVIHDTNIGRQYPCIFVYGGGAEVNIIDSNVLWNCGEAIQVVSDAIVRNNIILNSSISGITAAPHSQVSEMKNVTIVNNTIYGHPNCLYIRWSAATNMTLANNAVYCPQTTAVNATGLTRNSINIKNNYIEGSMLGVSIENNGFFAGGNANAIFGDPQNLNFWPVSSSMLAGNSSPSFASEFDFNGMKRNPPFDIGAYETNGSSNNTGWNIVPGFKQLFSTSKPAAPIDLRVF